MYCNNLKFQKSVDGLIAILKAEIEEYYASINIASIRKELKQAKSEIIKITGEREVSRAKKINHKDRKDRRRAERDPRSRRRARD